MSFPTAPPGSLMQDTMQFNRQATFPPPSHPATRHAPKPSPPRRHTYYEEPSYPDDEVLPTDVFAHPTQYTSLQEWLSEADAGLHASRSPTSGQTPPPEVTFPDLELLDAEIGAEEAFLRLSDDAYFALDDVRAVVHLDGDAVMEGEDEDIDAEGSTEDESEMVSDLEEPEDDDNVYEVVGGAPAVEEVPEPSSATQLQEQEQEQEHGQSSPENATKVLPCPSKRSSTAETLATETAGSTSDTHSRRSTPLDAPTTAHSISSRDGSVLTSADGEGETDDEYADSPDEECADSPDEEYADSPNEEYADSLDEEAASSATVSRASSPASSVSIPLSHHCRAASRASPDPQPESDLDDEATRSSPTRSSSLTPPPKSFTGRRARAPYQRTRPPVQPLEGIPEGSAEYSEVTKVYKCTCHGRTYRRKGDLQRHLAEGSLPEVCDGCGRGFPRKDPRIRHWNQNPLCEAIHHVKNINDVKEASRWNKRWTSAMFAGKVAAMERMVEEQLSVLASGADLINHVEPLIPRARTRTRVTPATRRPRHKKAAKRRFDSDEETGDDDDDGEHEEEDSFHPSKVVALAIVRDDLMSESRKATLRRKGQEL
ncbi:hypothetical protein FRC00_000116 [Tulasnella sp. 408]|nr:hypothetical protein FRC00_000116 [Tulasnella sp. 408]